MPAVIALALHCGLVAHAHVLEAIVRVESGGNPFALAVNGDVELVRHPRNREEAISMARWLEQHGYNFDAGLAQVNSANLARLGLDVASVFEPCANLRAASRVLEECYERALERWADEEGALTAALSCYNTGHFTRGVRNGYVAAVRAGIPRSLTLRPIAAANRAETVPPSGRWKERRHRGDGPLGPRGQAGVGAPRRDEAFAMAVADVFAARSREERAP